MAQQTIGIGAAPNDDTGDTLRVGGDKINDNFTELYARANVVASSDVETAGGTIEIQRFTFLDDNPDANYWSVIATHGGSFFTSDGSPIEYDDHVIVYGFNVAGSQVPIDADVVYNAVQWEGKFTNSIAAQFIAEINHEFREPSATTTKRWQSVGLPYDRTIRGLASWGMSMDWLVYSDWLDVQHIHVRLDNGHTTYLQPHSHIYTENNSVFTRQRNFADTDYWNLPYINASNQLQTQNPFFCQAGISANDCFIFQATGLDTNYSAFVIESPAVTGESLGVRIIGNNTTNFVGVSISNTYGGSLAHSVCRITTPGTNGAQSKVTFADTSFGGFEAGWKSDTKKWILAQVALLGINGSDFSYIEVDHATFRSQFFGPVGLKSYTVGTVPSASTHPNCQIMVSDETGGATPAFSDGTDWRRYADRAVVS